MKKNRKILLVLLLASLFLVGCQRDGESLDNEKESISLISREEGSGTRGAFIELLGIEEKNNKGEKTDRTSKEAIIQTKTDAVISTVAGDKNAIGYISVGSLNEDIKALKVDGYAPTEENIKNGNYKITRPFNIGVREDISDLAKDFIDFILSSEGQNIVGQDYISLDENIKDFNSDNSQGKLIIAGSSSVTPLMEILVEEYLKINTKANIEIQLSDSSSGIQAAIDGLADIAMVSRDLKDEELDKLKSQEIALDGIAIIVNSSNPIEDLSSETIKKIYMGEIRDWSKVE